MFNTKFPIILYHGVSSSAYECRYRDESELEWILSLEVFERQMKILKELNFNVTTIQELNDFNNAGKVLKKPIILTFDDGYEANYFNVFPVLKRYGFKAEFYITSDWIDSEGYMKSKQLIEMDIAGMSIQSHGKSHKFLTTLMVNDLNKELLESKRKIECVLNHDVNLISYPGGRFNSLTEECIVNSGYKGSFTSIRGYNNLFVQGLS
ncbi:MAG: polysaccharide deacetylase family protein [Prolixibacteraceae bacterium]|nr:polysaccharide deacetylase family protein [Prolixibacteraceae bacterium]